MASIVASRANAQVAIDLLLRNYRDIGDMRHLN